MLSIDIEKLKQFDESEYKKIIQHYSSGVIRYLEIKFGIDHHYAENIWQEVLFKLLDCINEGKINNERHLNNWLYTVSKNKALDLKKITENSRIEYRETLDDICWESQEEETSENDFLTICELHIPDFEKWRPNTKKIVELKYNEGRSIKEIAIELGIPKGTVKSSLSRMKKKCSNLEKLILEQKKGKNYE